MANTQLATELDFDQIKSDIISHFKNDPAFSDYNFEGSALNAIIDVLAYNTHTNAYYANMLHNEGFLDTAQKRSSVVSRAKELGYIPRSVVGSTAYVNVYAPSTDVGQVSIPMGATFTSSNDNGSYSFISTETRTAININGAYNFNQLKLVCGSPVKNYFVVNSLSNIRSIFTIPNKNVDISTLRLFVRDSSASTTRVEYFAAINAFGLIPTSRSFFVQESYDGFYQIYFGGDVIGFQPTNGNVVDIEYIVSNDLSAPDGCRLFNFDGQLGNATTINIETTQVSFGGSEREQVDSIKRNAVKSYSAKERYVSTSDYELMLKNNFDFIKSVSVWGGEDNIPPVYGKVFLSIQPVSGYTISDSVKRDVITPVIRSGNIMTIMPEYVDPSYTNIEFITRIKFDSSKTTSSELDVESNIKNIIKNYITSISSFNMDYLESGLVSQIMDSDGGIASVSIIKLVGFKLTPLIGVDTNHNKNINNQIIQGSVKSTKFYVNYSGISSLVVIKEIPDKYTSTENSVGVFETVARLGLYDDLNVLIREIGSVNLYTGKFSMTFGVYSYISDNRFIAIRTQLVDSDISTARNQILNIDSSIVDPNIGLLDNNVVIINSYGK